MQRRLRRRPETRLFRTLLGRNAASAGDTGVVLDADERAELKRRRHENAELRLDRQFLKRRRPISPPSITSRRLPDDRGAAEITHRKAVLHRSLSRTSHQFPQRSWRQSTIHAVMVAVQSTISTVMTDSSPSSSHRLPLSRLVIPGCSHGRRPSRATPACRHHRCCWCAHGGFCISEVDHTARIVAMSRSGATTYSVISLRPRTAAA